MPPMRRPSATLVAWLGLVTALVTLAAAVIDALY